MKQKLLFIYFMTFIVGCSIKQSPNLQYGTYVSNPSSFEIIHNKFLGKKVISGSLTLSANNRFVFSQCRKEDELEGKWTIQGDTLFLHADSTYKKITFYPNSLFFKDGKLYGEKKWKNSILVRILELKSK